MKPSTRSVKFTKIDVETLNAVDEVLQAFSVTETSTGEHLGFVASATQNHTAPSGRVYSPVKWGFAVNKDEFRSGIQFGYGIRLQAGHGLLRSVKG
jgi:hypothetical protein